MVLSKEDLAVIKACFAEKGWSARKIIREFSGKNWKRSTVQYVINKIRESGSTDRKRGSGRPSTARTRENERYVEEHASSQENNPGTRLSQRKMANKLNISRNSVQNIMKSKGIKKIGGQCNIDFNRKMSVLNRSSVQNFTQFGRKIVAIGRNYKDHCAELGNPVPKTPLLFMKPPSSYLVEGNGPILIPRGCSQLHHEVELGIVIDSKCQDVKEQDAMNYIAGYALALDMTARDFQNEAKAKGNPWTMAKCFDTALPISRFIELEEISNPSDIELWCKVNDVQRQKGVTSDMVFSIPYLISHISQYFTLEPGDLVLTGTPAGVGPVADGDVISCGIGNLIEMKFDVKRKL